MKIGILGTGSVGRAFAGRLNAMEHEVTIGTRNVEDTLSKTGEGTLADFLGNNPRIKLSSFSDTARTSEISFLVTKGAATLDVIKMTGADNLRDKILVDVTNPLDFSKGMPPSLIPELSNTNSLGEEIQKQLPQTKVVKTLNTMWNGLMINPSIVNDGNHVNYICGNDGQAKTKVKALLFEMGWKPECVVDLGDITGARATEATLPIWLRVYGARKSGAFNFNIVS
jgi:8-hydroxy-5-deazaflavin:NADPH oxidoreductase